jgi:diguanylate cyclase (GGDEF)-like protein
MIRDGSWLCPTEIDRARVVDNSRRVRSARLFGAAVIGLALIALVPYLGAWPLVFLAASGVNLVALDPVMARISRPELAVAATLILTELMIAGAVATTGAGTSPLVPWLAVPIGMSAARFRLRVVLAGVGIGLVVMAACTLAVDPASVLDSPELSIVTVALIGNVVAIAAALQHAELHHRTESVLDQLTGLLNRKALDSRVAELAEQARISDAPVSLIAIDIDAFKGVNDTHGHVRGDAALRDVAYQMRKATRNFELIYRFGGEEFVVVLPGLDSEEAGAVAERLRRAVEETACTDLRLTISAGVATAHGEEVELQSLFERADAALYRAKQGGRNQVVVDPRPGASAPASVEEAAQMAAVDAGLAGAIG